MGGTSKSAYMKNKHKEALSSDIFGYRKAAAAEVEVAKAHSNSNSIETTEEDATGDNKEMLFTFNIR